MKSNLNQSNQLKNINNNMNNGGGDLSVISETIYQNHQQNLLKNGMNNFYYSLLSNNK